MRQLIRTYEITGDHEITITGYTFTKEDVRLIIDETVAITNKKASILVSSTAKNNIVSIVNGVITLSNSTVNLTVGDELTIEIDIDNVAKSSEIPTVAQIQDGLAKELDASNNKAEIIESINSVVNGQAGAIINTVNSQAGSVINTVNSQAGSVINTVNSLASATNGIINLQTNTISTTINTQASDLTLHINGKTDSIINTVNAQAQAIAAQLDNSIAKQGDDPNTSLSDIKTTAQQAAADASAAKTAAQALSPIALAADAYNTGKVELAANITAKGVQASASETLSQLAQKVTAITQQHIILSPSEVGDMYAKQLFGSLTTPNYWNLYDVMTALLNNTNSAEFGGILLGEYYKGYASFEIGGSGATSAGSGGGYVYSDEFSIAQDGTVSFTIHRVDETHYWNDMYDGKANRWVAWLFSGESHGFSISSSNAAPKSIYIGRHVGSIEFSVNTSCSEIVVTDGNLLDSVNFGGFSHKIGKNFILRNIALSPTLSKSIASGIIYIDTDVVGTIFDESNVENSTVNSIIVKGNSLEQTLLNFALGSLSALNTIYLDVRFIRGGLYFQYYSVILPVKELVIRTEDAEFFLINRTSENPLIYLKSFNIEYITNDKTKTVKVSETNTNVIAAITDISIQDGWNKPLNVASFNKMTEGNMYAHILQRLKQDEADCGDGVTITLGQTNLDKLTSQESIALLDDLTNIYGYTFA